MSSEQTANAKKTLRALLKNARAELAKDPKSRDGLTFNLAALATQTGATTIAAYLPYGTEPDIGGFIAAAHAAGTRLIMPVSNTDGTLSWVEYTGQTEPGIFGFDEPIGKPASLQEAQLILVPASAADSRGNRLGKGKGYYDIALAESTANAITAAVIYEAELLAAVPTEAHDHPMNYIVTPQRLLQIS